jgi:hypothetical protein
MVPQWFGRHGRTVAMADEASAQKKWPETGRVDRKIN